MMKDEDALKKLNTRDGIETAENAASRNVHDRQNNMTNHAVDSCPGKQSYRSGSALSSSDDSVSEQNRMQVTESAGVRVKETSIDNDADAVRMPKLRKTVILKLPEEDEKKKNPKETSKPKKSGFSLGQFFRSKGNTEKHRQELIYKIKILLMDAHMSGRMEVRSEHISLRLGENHISGKHIPAVSKVNVTLPDFSNWKTSRLESYLKQLEYEMAARISKRESNKAKREQLIQDLKLLFIGNHIGWGEEALQFYEINVSMPVFSAWSTDILEAYHRVMMNAKTRWERHDPNASEAYHYDLWRLCELFYLKTRGVDPSKCFTMDAGLIAKCVRQMSSGNMADAEAIYDKEIRLFYGVPKFDTWSNCDLARYLVRIELLLRVQERGSLNQQQGSVPAHGRSHTAKLECSYIECAPKSGRQPTMEEAFKELELRIELRKRGNHVSSSQGENTNTSKVDDNKHQQRPNPGIQPPKTSHCAPHAAVVNMPAVLPPNPPVNMPPVPHHASAVNMPSVPHHAHGSNVSSSSDIPEETRPILQAVVLADFGASSNRPENESVSAENSLLSWQALSHSKLFAVPPATCASDTMKCGMMTNHPTESVSMPSSSWSQLHPLSPTVSGMGAPNSNMGNLPQPQAFENAHTPPAHQHPSASAVSGSNPSDTLRVDLTQPQASENAQVPSSPWDVLLQSSPNVSNTGSSDTLRVELPKLPIPDNRKKPESATRKGSRKAKRKRRQDGSLVSEDGLPLVMTGKEARALKAKRQAEKIKAGRAGSTELEEALVASNRAEEALTAQFAFSDEVLAILDAEADVLGLDDEPWEIPLSKDDLSSSPWHLPAYQPEQTPKCAEIFAMPETTADMDNPEQTAHGLIQQFADDVLLWIEDDTPLDPRISDYRRSIFNCMREFVRYFDAGDRFMAARICAESIRILKELPFLSISRPNLQRDMTGALFSVLDLMTGWADDLKTDEATMRLPLIQAWRAKFGGQLSDDQIYERALVALGCTGYNDRYHPMFWRYAFDMDPSQFDYRRFVSCIEGLLRWHGRQVPELPQCDVAMPLEVWCKSWSRAVFAQGLILSEYHYNPAFSGSRRYYFLTPYDRIDLLQKLFSACNQQAHLRVWM